MALIYRSIFQIDDAGGTFLDRVPRHVRDWLRFKLRDSTIDVRLDGSDDFSEQGIELTTRAGSSDECSVVRVEAFEGSREDGVEVKTTLTAIRGADESWGWVDLERWTHDDQVAPWIPAPPGIAVTLLVKESARNGDLALRRTAAHVSGEGGRLVADLAVDSGRRVPLVVVSYNEREADGVRVAGQRGYELAKRLAGVAVVYVLEDGAVTSFSKAMYEAVGDGMDVHSGAVRTYLPGAAATTDSAGRHRYVPFRKIEARRADLAARLIAPHLLRRAVESPPPPIWRSSARALLIGHEPDTDYDELLSVADAEIAELRSIQAQMREQLDAEREDNIELQRRTDDLGRRLAYFREQVRSLEPAALELEPHNELFEPVLCTEVLAHARNVLPMIEIPETVDRGAEVLDAHGDESWAGRAWSALQALNHYALMKQDGTFDGSFLTYCVNGAGDHVIPSSQVVPTESAQTLADRRFYDLRVLPVSTRVDESGSTLMQEHIRIERGGTPSPRVHYYDDTRGETGRIHIGWFGDHLDSRAKS